MIFFYLYILFSKNALQNLTSRYIITITLQSVIIYLGFYIGEKKWQIIIITDY